MDSDGTAKAAAEKCVQTLCALRFRWAKHRLMPRAFPVLIPRNGHSRNFLLEVPHATIYGQLFRFLDMRIAWLIGTRIYRAATNHAIWRSPMRLPPTSAPGDWRSAIDCRRNASSPSVSMWI